LRFSIRNSFFGFVGFTFPAKIMLVVYPELFYQFVAETVGLFLLAISLRAAWVLWGFHASAVALKLVAEDCASRDTQGAANVIVIRVAFYALLYEVGPVAI
jgi:hypothetical protein